ncbi:MAG: DUF7718 family protein [Limisphaerales bacterium]
MPQKDYIIWLDDQTYVRVDFVTVSGRVVSFVVSLMRAKDEKLTSIVRYDTAHGMPHRDLLDRRGRVVRKDWLPEMPFDQALTHAKIDLVENYEKYIKAHEAA